MLKRLRWKFTLILMLILSGALAAALAVQTVSAVRQYQAGTERVLQAVLRRAQGMADPWGVPRDDGALHRDDGLYTTIPAFCAMVDGEGKIVLAVAYNAAVSEDDVVRAVEGAVENGARTAALSKQGLRYEVQPVGPYLAIAFADLSWEEEG